MLMLEITPIFLLAMMSTVCITTASRLRVFLLVIIYTTYTTTANTAISMCSTISTGGRSVELNRNNSDNINCYCVVKLSTGSTSETISVIEQINSTGCQYQIQFTLHNDTKEYSCDRRDEVSFYMMNQDEIQIQLVPGRDTTGGFIFRLEISSGTSGNTVDLACYNPPQTSLSTIQKEITSKTDITTQILQATTNVTNDSIILQTITEYSSTEPTTTDNPDTRTPTTITINNTVITQTASDSPTNVLLPAIIGASVGGVVLVVVIIIFILIIRRIRARKDQPQVVTDNQVHTEAPIITNNDLYISYDTVKSQNNVTIISKTDNPIIIKNELYVSFEQAQGNGQNGNHGDTESDHPTEYKKHPADVYAVVQKTSKPQKSNVTEVKHESSFIVGPHGDEYSVVNKQ